MIYVVKKKQLHAIQSKGFAGVVSTMANTRENLTETNEFSLIICLLESNKVSSSAWRFE